MPARGWEPRSAGCSSTTRPPASDAHPRRALPRARPLGGIGAPRDRAWKDTVIVAVGETVIVQPRFAPYAGRYVFHCHNLEHQERAMMLQLEVA